MRDSLLLLYTKFQTLMTSGRGEEGQDLVEYAAVIVLVVLALTGGMSTLAQGINSAMATIGTDITTTL